MLLKENYIYKEKIMGDSSGNCAVSNLPIESGDEVLWIYSKLDYVTTTHDLGDSVRRYADRLYENERLEKKNLEFRNSFPNETELLFTIFTIPTVEKDFESGFGMYDSYGWVENEELPDEYFDKGVLIRKQVADKLAEFGKTLIDREWGKDKQYLKDNYLYCLLLVCYLTRIHVFGHFLLGRQYADKHEMKEQKFVHKVIGDELKAIDSKIKKQDKEYMQWCKEIHGM